MKTFPNLRSLMAALILSATLAAGAKTIEVNLTALGVKPDTQKSQTLNCVELQTMKALPWQLAQLRHPYGT